LINPAQRNWAQFLEAGAARDRKSIAILGSDILERDSTLSDELRAQLLAAVTLTLMGDGDSAAALKLLLRDQALIEQRREDDLGLRLAEAVAIASLPRTADNSSNPRAN
jgi:hypothetical protein